MWGSDVWGSDGPYFLCWCSGAVMALAVGAVAARREGLAPARVLTGLLVLGLILYGGARAHALLLEEGRDLRALFAEPQMWLGWGLRLPGGLLACVLAGPIVTLGLKLPYARFSDIATIAGAILFAVGRIGCHVAGCCFGTPSTLPWAISYDSGSAVFFVHVARGLIPANAPESLPVHPFALYLSLAATLTFAFLVWLGRRGAADGARTLAGLTLFGIAFGAVESVRDTGGSAPPLYRQEMWLAVGIVAGLLWLVRSYVGRRVRHRQGTPARIYQPTTLTIEAGPAGESAR